MLLIFEDMTAFKEAVFVFRGFSLPVKTLHLATTKRLDEFDEREKKNEA